MKVRKIELRLLIVLAVYLFSIGGILLFHSQELIWKILYIQDIWDKKKALD